MIANTLERRPFPFDASWPKLWQEGFVWTLRLAIHPKHLGKNKGLSPLSIRRMITFLPRRSKVNQSSAEQITAECSLSKPHLEDVTLHVG